ncbi:MAG: type III-B CRISPR module-associated protein Cmr3, partial [Clostridia bacterium]|nr:type III-B CRISPR module-associated protein Cmr3 [Clostridia bacterium]
MIRKFYELEPNDVLFFRDGRPMDVDKKKQDVRNIGHGANWPRPDHLFKGVIHSLIGERMASLEDIRQNDKEGNSSYGEFGGLRVVGPFPKKGDDVYLPRPLD